MMTFPPDLVTAPAPAPPGCADLTSPACATETAGNAVLPGAGTLGRAAVEGGGQVLNDAAGAAAKGAVQYGVNGLAEAIQYAVSWLITNTVSWWVRIDSPCLVADPVASCTGGTSASEVIGRMQQWTLPLAVAIATLSLLAAAAKIAITRKTTPLLDVGTGLLVIVATTSLGVLLPALLLKIGDEWSAWVLNMSTGDFAKRLTTVLGLTGASPGVVIVLGIVAIIAAAAQAVLMLFRQAALVVLAGVLPLAAAGSMTALTRPWFRRVTGWMLALIFYKPAAAMVYATAFAMLGNATDAQSTFMGFAMIVLSILALPALLKFFTWATGSISETASSGGFLGTVVGGAVAVGAFRGGRGLGGAGGASAVDHARFMSSSMPPPGGARPSASGPVPAPGPAPAGGARTASARQTSTAATASTATAAKAGAAAGPAGAAAGAVVSGLASGAKKAGGTVSDSMTPPRQERT
ncbi:hypothetical protein ACFHYQ_08870 [Sphaerimonospora cavernae]|uniref:TrbL/VirB6 plasmid conjugal transfer protein n=1 Tax=Sphaerimonospora cavernae TaxID=1740611 RepID=A0ABV6U1T9_9ACTN